jgi:hypothetical protein
MNYRNIILSFVLCVDGIVAGTAAANASSLIFSTGDPDGKIASASRPAGASTSQIETADDFVLTTATAITGATFIGPLPSGASVTNVVIEIYRVFPQDSDLSRTSGPAVFSTSQVPTRVNSPSDVAADSRSSATSSLNFSASVLSPSFTANNTVQAGGIHATPNQTTSGDGPVTGQEVEFDISFLTALMLAADHYFFVPQVQLDSGDFLWLSAPKPIVLGTPFAPDLQGWARDDSLAPDWLRIGTDIVGGSPVPTYNFTFSLVGDSVAAPLPSALPLLATGLGAFGLLGWRRMRKAKLAA